MEPEQLKMEPEQLKAAKVFTALRANEDMRHMIWCNACSSLKGLMIHWRQDLRMQSSMADPFSDFAYQDRPQSRCENNQNITSAISPSWMTDHPSSMPKPVRFEQIEVVTVHNIPDNTLIRMKYMPCLNRQRILKFIVAVGCKYFLNNHSNLDIALNRNSHKISSHCPSMNRSHRTMIEVSQSAEDTEIHCQSWLASISWITIQIQRSH